MVFSNLNFGVPAIKPSLFLENIQFFFSVIYVLQQINHVANQCSKKCPTSTAAMKVKSIQILITHILISLTAFHIFLILKGKLKGKKVFLCDSCPIRQHSFCFTDYDKDKYSEMEIKWPYWWCLVRQTKLSLVLYTTAIADRGEKLSASVQWIWLRSSS